MFWTLSATLFLCVGFYMYFINTTIHNVVAYQNLENEVAQLTLKIGKQEFQYISMRNGITLATAHSLGFKETSVKTFISRQVSTKVALLTQ